MTQKYLETVLTPTVQAAQDRFFGRHQQAGTGTAPDELRPPESDFIESRDSFYLATVSEDGWPYLQHRGGPIGFFKVLGPRQLGFADYRGNRQLLTTGNLAHRDRVALFLMDYPSKSRLKILGHARVVSAAEEPALAARLTDPTMAKRVERLFLIEVESYDWNCPQYITPRFTAAQIEDAVTPLKARIAELEAKLAQK